jgi:cell division protein ZapA (FtsZ GTPase activity inhibitor)
MSKRSVAVEIAGQQYRIRSDADEDALHRLATYVDRAMVRVRQGTGTVDSLDVAVLTCLNLAREILALREQRGAVAEEEKLRALIERVESELGASTREPRSDGAATEASDLYESTGGDANESSAREDPTTRTLDLPSIEALHDRVTPADDADSESANALPEARVASGGRDRAS